MATATYRDIQKGEGFDPIAYLFGTERPYVAESAFTPELTLRYYEELAKRIPVNLLAGRGTGNSQGLESLQGLVTHEPNPSHLEVGDWMERLNVPAILERSVQGKVSKQMQYLPLQIFRFPKWEEMPRKKHVEYPGLYVLDQVSAEALLVSRSNRLYFVGATWLPSEETAWYRERPRFVARFTLSALAVDEVTWKDRRIMERIRNGAWSNCHAAANRAFLALRETIEGHNAKARQLKGISRDLEFARNGVYHGR